MTITIMTTRFYDKSVKEWEAALTADPAYQVKLQLKWRMSKKGEWLLYEHPMVYRPERGFGRDFLTDLCFAQTDDQEGLDWPVCSVDFIIVLLACDSARCDFAYT